MISDVMTDLDMEVVIHASGPGILEFFGPQMALAYWLDAISQGPKTFEFQGPIPSHLS